MEDNEVLFNGKIYTQYFQVALFDAEVKDSYPQWKTGEETVVFGSRGVAVATANDTDVNVVVKRGKANPDYKLCVSGEILVGSKGIIVGNEVASSISLIPLQSGDYSIVIYTNGLGPDTNQVYFCINRLSKE